MIPSKSRDLEDFINCANSTAVSLNLGTTDVWGWVTVTRGELPSALQDGQRCLLPLLLPACSTSPTQLPSQMSPDTAQYPLEGRGAQNHLQFKTSGYRQTWAKFQIHHSLICKMGINISQLKEFGGIFNGKLCKPWAQFWHIVKAQQVLAITKIAVIY